MNVTNDPRLAGQVARYHTWPVLQPQSNAEHAWNVARIICTVCPGASTGLLIEALLHDSGEIVSGDIPFPVKQNNPALKKEMDRIEGGARGQMFLEWRQPLPVVLNENERDLLKIADMMEMWEKGLHERMLGNAYATPIIDRTWEWLDARLDKLPQGPLQENLQKYIVNRLREHGRLDLTGQEHPFGFNAAEDVA